VASEDLPHLFDAESARPYSAAKTEPKQTIITNPPEARTWLSSRPSKAG